MSGLLNRSVQKMLDMAMQIARSEYKTDVRLCQDLRGAL